MFESIETIMFIVAVLFIEIQINCMLFNTRTQFHRSRRTFIAENEAMEKSRLCDVLSMRLHRRFAYERRKSERKKKEEKI